MATPRTFGEPVSQRARALQCGVAALAANGAAPSLVGAALLHDIGHLLHGLDESIADQGGRAARGRGTRLADAPLRRRGHRAGAPPRRREALSVRRRSHHAAALSPASVQSLALQGGAFNRSQAPRSPIFPSPRTRSAAALGRCRQDFRSRSAGCRTLSRPADLAGPDARGAQGRAREREERDS